jgi:hypothetical protein
MTWFRIILALCAVVIALSVASVAVRGYVDWHDKRAYAAQHPRNIFDDQP